LLSGAVPRTQPVVAAQDPSRNAFTVHDGTMVTMAISAGAGFLTLPRLAAVRWRKLCAGNANTSGGGGFGIVVVRYQT